MARPDSSFSSKNVETKTCMSVPFCASEIAEFSHVSPPRMGRLMPRAEACSMICGA